MLILRHYMATKFASIQVNHLTTLISMYTVFLIKLDRSELSSPTILKKDLCLSLQDFLNLKKLHNFLLAKPYGSANLKLILSNASKYRPRARHASANARLRGAYNRGKNV